ncbi:MAG TPA: rhodanese-like domain-containing protein [Acidimicrobiia bacterium]|jgi:rhodanese-related sulfurtransferase|nr:rhodanese-like domain-containing protein [Acidimicrobiia bacterium]
MSVTVDDLLASARARIRRLDPHETAAAYRRGALLIDIRPTVQRRWEGEVPGAVVIERNVLEWRVDPASAHRLAQITDHDREIVVMCSEGYASSLVAATLVDLGFASAADLEGGFQAWAKAGLPVRNARRRPRLRAAS